MPICKLDQAIISYCSVVLVVVVVVAVAAAAVAAAARKQAGATLYRDLECYLRPEPHRAWDWGIRIAVLCTSSTSCGLHRRIMAGVCCCLGLFCFHEAQWVWRYVA